MHYSVADCLLDLIQNSIEAHATVISVELVEQPDTSLLRCSLVDNGKGMTAEVLERAKDPFYTDGEKHVARKVGLGIPFLIQMVQSVNGSWNIQSTPNQGTAVQFSLPMDNLDAPPLGSVPTCLLAACTYPGEFELSFRRVRGSEEYSLSRKDLLEALGDFTSVDSLQLLSQFLENWEQELL